MSLQVSPANASRASLHTQRWGARLWPSTLSILARHLLRRAWPQNLQQKPEQAEDIIGSFVHQFDTTNLPSIWDPELESLCMKEVEHRGYALEVLKPYLVVGLNIAASVYHHIDNVNIKVYIAIYTMFFLYFDDAYPDDPDALVGVPNFTKHFASSEKQPTKMLDNFMGILAEASQLFGKVTADFIVQGILRFMTALILEIQSKSEPRHKVDKYAMFLRELSGNAEAYAMFIFPAELPYSIYIQALPLLRDVICFINNIVSFYKEEADSENYNLILMLAEAKDYNSLQYGGEMHEGTRESVAYLVTTQRHARDVQGVCKGVLSVPFGYKEIQTQ